jgi:hypothetical protein
LHKNNRFLLTSDLKKNDIARAAVFLPGPGQPKGDRERHTKVEKHTPQKLL